MEVTVIYPKTVQKGTHQTFRGGKMQVGGFADLMRVFQYKIDKPMPDALDHVYHNWQNGVPGSTEEGAKRRDRSMSVGDVVMVEGRWFICDFIGWQEVPLEWALKWLVADLSGADRNMGPRFCVEQGRMPKPAVPFKQS